MKNKYLLLLYNVSYKTIYTFIYKRNVCCHYTLSYDLAMIIVVIHLLYNEKIHFHVVRNVCCHYMSSYIMRNIFSLYIISYNTTSPSCIREMFVVIIHRLV